MIFHYLLIKTMRSSPANTVCLYGAFEIVNLCVDYPVDSNLFSFIFETLVIVMNSETLGTPKANSKKCIQI